MTQTHDELRSNYEDFLRADEFSQIQRIATAIDDYNALSLRRSSQSVNNTNNNKSSTKNGTFNKSTIMSHSYSHGCPRVKFPLSELRSTHSELEKQMKGDPQRHLRALESACHLVALEERPGYDKNRLRIKVSMEGPVGALPHSPRSLLSSFLRRLVCVEGVAIKVSAVKPKMVRSVHYCPATKLHQSRDYADATDPNLGLPMVDDSGREIPDRLVDITGAAMPTRDKDHNMLETEFGLSRYKDHQTVTLQEMPERAPMGQLPRSVDLVLDEDLVDRVKPGDRVRVNGVYRALATSTQGQHSTSGLFRTVLLVNDISILGRDTSPLNYLPEDISAIKQLSQTKNILSLLGKSLAPSIHGHGIIKQSLILQLLSGCERNLDNGTHLRGDINILMVGDPSTAKSQLLRTVMSTAPLAISTTGKGSSGVGLTAAVTSDPETKERRLEAGAMVLGDRGIVCVDEFDKMSENDRVAIHEAMEQQTVTIAKAGIHASLNARCSVLAAANPVWGRYDRKRRIQENIGLPDSLLSRFDLLFVVLDCVDPDGDRRIANHVIRGHRYRSLAQTRRSDVGNCEEDEDDFDDEDEDDEENNNPNSNNNSQSNIANVWKRSHLAAQPQTIQNANTSDNSNNDEEEILQKDFLRKYLHFAKTRIQPVLTDESREYVASRYAEMRSRQNERTLPVTARTLETVIRLASAHAKARLSRTVEAEPDCEKAMELLSFALYHESNTQDQSNGDNVGEDVNNKRKDDDTPRLDMDEDPDATPKKRMRLDDDEEDTNTTTDTTSQKKQLEDLSSRIWQEISTAEGGIAVVSNICADVTDRKLVETALKQLENGNRIMLDGNDVYLV